MDKYFFVSKDLSRKRKRLFKKIFDTILTDFINRDEQRLSADYIRLARIGLKTNMPYVVLLSEVEYIKNEILRLYLEHRMNDEALCLCNYYQKFEGRIASVYLQSYITHLIHKNNIRICSLKELIEKSIVTFYEGHLEWLNKLIHAIDKLDSGKVPEMDSGRCVFGRWLKHEGKTVIRNNSKYREITGLHEKLHMIARKIESILRNEKQVDYHIFMSYLEKAELISLDIGTELALIDNSNFIKRSQKDRLTGTLSRNVLEQVFLHEYELSLATEKNFVLAMSDLDDFKGINDTYGHVAGDRVLKGFAEIALETLRSSDVVIRYGGEEFLLILNAVDFEKGKEVLEKIRRKFEAFYIEEEGERVQTTVSFGVIEIEPPSDIKYSEIDVDNYIRAVDDKLYLAKRSGKNRVR